MSDTQKVLEHAAVTILKPRGYTKRGRTWHRVGAASIAVVNLQKSQWGDTWYLNLGVYLRRLGPAARPPESRCHIRTRAEALAAISLPQDPVAFGKLLSTIAVPWLEQLSTEAGIEQFLVSPEAARCFVHRDVRVPRASPGVASA